MSASNEGLVESEEDLLICLSSKSQADNDAGWQTVYKSCYPTVRDFIVRNKGNENDATDVFQDGLMIFYRNLQNRTFRKESSIKTYVFRICRNLWLKELQKQQKLQVVANEIAISPTDDARSYLIDVEIITLLMNELKEDCRRILTEYYYNNRSMAELKEMFNVSSIQAAKNKKLRCMGYLVRLCNERGISPTTSQ